MNTIVIEFCPEDRARLDALLSIGERLAQDLEAAHGIQTVYTDEVIYDPTNEPGPVPGVEDLPVPPVSAPVAPPPAPVISLPEFQKAVMGLIAKSDDLKKRAQELIPQYADCVSNIPEGRRAEFLAELQKV